MTTQQAAGAVVELSKPKLDRKFVTAAMMLMMVLASMEQTVTSTAMYSIVGELNGMKLYAWVPAIYLLAATVTMPLYGRLADMLGRKRVILGAVGLFTIGSVLAAFAQSMPQLIVFRAIQGLGAGGIMPVVLTILGDIYTLKERAKIQGLFSVIWGTAALAGPLLGAYLVHSMGWRSIFWVNLPFGLLGLAMMEWKYHDHEKSHKTDLDLVGVVTLALGSAALLMAVSSVGESADASAVGMLIGAVLVAAGALGFFVWHERRAEHPIMPPEVILSATIGPCVLASLVMGLGIFSLDTYVPLYVQGGMGRTVQAAAMTVTPVMFAWALSSFLAAPLMLRWGFRKTSMVGSVLIIVGFSGVLVCTLVGAPMSVLTAVLTVTGFGFGPTSMSYLLGAQGAVDYQRRGIVTSSITFSRTMGGAIGVGVLGSVLNFVMRNDVPMASAATQAAATQVATTHAAATQIAATQVAATQIATTHAAATQAAATQIAATQPLVLPEAHAAVLAHSPAAIVSGMHWVLGFMVVFAIVQLLVSTYVPRKKSDHAVSGTEALETMG